MSRDQIAPLSLIFLFWLLVSAIGYLQQGHVVADGYVLGPDSYTRLLRVEGLADTLDWYQARIFDLAWPEGVDMHWTRPLDVLILVPALPLMMVMEAPAAIFWSGAMISAFSLLVAVFAFVWAIRPIAPGASWFLPTCALLAQPVVIGYGRIGRVDHHMLLLALFVVAAGFLIRAMRTPDNRRAALGCGLALGVAMWVSVEALMLVLPMLAALALVWAGRLMDDRTGGYFARGLFVSMLFAVVVEVPPSRWLVPVYDSLSIVHLTLVAGIWLFWWAVAGLEARGRQPGRFFVLVAAALVGGAAMQVLFPAFFSGPLANVSAREAGIWLARVNEMKPLLPTDAGSAAEFVYLLGNCLFAVPYTIWMLRRVHGRGNDPVDAADRRLWLAIGVLLMISLAASVLHLRFAMYGEVVLLMVIAVAWARADTGALRPDGSLRIAAVRAGVIIAMVLGTTMTGGAMVMSHEDRPAYEVANSIAGRVGCDLKELGQYLDSRARDPMVVLTLVDYGPALVYFSRQRALGGPYHRSAEAILANRSLLANTNLDAARKGLADRAVDVIVLCETGSERNFYGQNESLSLYMELIAGNYPDWLAPVDPPAQVGPGAHIFAVSARARAALVAGD